MPIRVLEPDVAAKIAAGEVVERPASVVKELVENAIDAGASEIRVEIRGGGQREIKIVDDGCGIPADELELAFQRHATSKLHIADDLFNVRTLGFRGEALPSIATVSQLICTTRTAAAPTGVELRIAGGQVQNRTPRGGSPGTSFVVKNLFYNTPARLKFLRSEATESAQISSVIERYALAYPEIKWTLLIDGRLSLQTPGSGQLLDALVELYGIDVARQLIAVADAAGDGDQRTAISGFISQPSLTRSARSAIHLFVNKRWVRATGPIVYVLEEAYHNLLMKGRHPLAILNIQVDPAAVDVNVHPTKSEVKFLYQSQVFALLGRAVRAALAEHAGVQDLALGASRAAETVQRRIELRQIGARHADARSAWQQPDWLEPTPAMPRPEAEPSVEPDWGARPDTAPPIFSEGWSQRDDRAADVPDDRLVERASVVGEQRDGVSPTSPPASDGRTSGVARLPPLRVVGQVNETYIVAEAPEGMYLIDQHAAHERIVYERLMRRRQTEPLGRQHLLLPLSVDVPPAAVTLLIGHRDLLDEWGFEVEEFGEGTLRVRSIPQELHEAEVGPALLEIAAHLDGERGATPQDRQEQITITIACHSSVRAGQVLSHEEMRQLLQQLERCAFPRTCPHGRPTVLLLSQSQLERQFGRRG